jgi:hypothetical protein
MVPLVYGCRPFSIAKAGFEGRASFTHPITGGVLSGQWEASSQQVANGVRQGT